MSRDPIRAEGAQIVCDDLDRRILAELAANARLSNVELAERLPLTHSAISRRVARLEREGAITGYVAEISPRALGLTLTAFVSVRRDPATPVDAMAAALKQIPGVTAAWIVSGEHDLMLHVQAADLQTFSDTLLNHIQGVAGVSATLSVFVLQKL